MEIYHRRLYMLKCPADEKELNQLLSEPALALIEMIKRLESIKTTGVACEYLQIFRISL